MLEATIGRCVRASHAQFGHQVAGANICSKKSQEAGVPLHFTLMEEESRLAGVAAVDNV